MVSGRGLLGLGCVVALAVMVGIIGASVVMGGFTVATLRQAPAQSLLPPIIVATPTVVHMEPLPGRIDAPRLAGYTMTADESDAEAVADAFTSAKASPERALISQGSAFYLPNGTLVQILQVDGHLCRVQVMSGQHVNRSGWLPVNMTSTAPPTPARR